MTEPSSAVAPDPVVVVSSLSIAQRSGRVLLRDVNLDLRPGEVVILAGPSGSGKSTLVNLLSGAIEMREGGWEVSGHVGFAGETYDLAHERVTVGGVVFQNFALFDELTVAENLTIAADHNPAVSDSLKTAIDGLLRDVDRSLPVNAASGGQKQRIAIARTLLGNHPVLFLDEPNSGLDVSASRRLSQLVKELAQEIGVPVIIIAHHFRHLIDVADRVLMLDPRANDLIELPVDAGRIEHELDAIETGQPRAPAPPPEQVKPSTRAPAAVATRPPDRAGQATIQASTGAWRPMWGLRFLLGYLWELCFAPSALLFIGLGSVITGFVTTWFIFMYLPFRDYLLPIIHSDALAGLAFSELRVLAPLLTAVLISTRNSALIGADIGHKVYSDQIKSMRNLNVPHKIYITATVLLSSAVAAVVLTTASVSLTAWVAMVTWAQIFPEGSTYLWRDQYFQRLWPPGELLMVGTDWILIKAIPSIMGASAIALYFGYRPKTDVVDINKAIAESLIWGLSFVLTWQSILTLIEFKQVSARLEATF